AAAFAREEAHLDAVVAEERRQVLIEPGGVAGAVAGGEERHPAGGPGCGPWCRRLGLAGLGRRAERGEARARAARVVLRKGRRAIDPERLLEERPARA